jgi:anti-sigma factor RsiW
MCDRHWTDDELLLRLFDERPADEHLETCVECGRRWEAIQDKYESRRETLSEISEARLAAQRIAVHARLEAKSRNSRLILAPSLVALAALVLIASMVFKSASLKPLAPETISGDEVFEEVFGMSLSTEPTAIGPVQSLFEEQP